MVFAATSASAQDRSAESLNRAPHLTIERHPEDWSYLADPNAGSGRWTEQSKYVPISDNGSQYLTIGVEARSRYESLANPGWGARPDDDYLWLRFMPYADHHAGRFRLFTQPIISSTTRTDRLRTPVDTTGADVLQAFGEIAFTVGNGAALSVSAGRKVFSLGAGRFVDSRYGPNVPQPFDGIDAAVTREGSTFKLMYVRPVDTRPGPLNDLGSTRQALWEFYVTQLVGRDGRGGLDLFYLGFRDRRSVVDQDVGRLLVHTFGARFFGDRGAWSWNVEGAFQAGSFGDKNVRAFGFGSEVGCRLYKVMLRPALALTLDYASGDSDPDDDSFETMNPLFPRGQYFVSQSPIGPRNLIHLRAVLTIHPLEPVTLSVTGAGYWRASTRDGIYNMPGYLERSGRNSALGSSASSMRLPQAGRRCPNLICVPRSASLLLSGSCERPDRRKR